MKKLLSVMLTAVFSLSIFSGVASAEGNVPDGMKEAVEENLKGSHYDFKDGTVHFEELETFVSAENAQIAAAIVEYETVRDDWFITTHTQIVYYDVTNAKVLTKAAVSGVEGIADYQSKHDDALSAHMHWDIIFIIHLLVLIIPAFILIVWIKREYSTTEYQVANNILGNVKSF